MKTKSILIFLLFSIIISSCGKHFSLEKRHYRKGFYFAKNHKAHNTKSKAETPNYAKVEVNPSHQAQASMVPATLPDADSIHSRETVLNQTKSLLKEGFGKRKFQQLMQKLDQPELPEYAKKTIQYIGKANERQKKSGFIQILFDIILLGIGIFTSILFLFFSFEAFSSSRTPDDNKIGALFLILAIICFVAPLVRLISDLN